MWRGGAPFDLLDFRAELDGIPSLRFGGVPGFERLLNFRKTGKDLLGKEEDLDALLRSWQAEQFDLKKV